jgi:chromosome segregation ATPase
MTSEEQIAAHLAEIASRDAQIASLGVEITSRDVRIASLSADITTLNTVFAALQESAAFLQIRCDQHEIEARREKARADGLASRAQPAGFTVTVAELKKRLVPMLFALGSAAPEVQARWDRVLSTLDAFEAINLHDTTLSQMLGLAKSQGLIDDAGIKNVLRETL